MAFCLTSCATTQVMFTEDDQQAFVFEDVPGTKGELYLKAHKWMTEIFNNAESVIQHSDKEEGAIMGKYLMFGETKSGMYGTMVDSRVYATIDIRVKDNKARIEVKPQGSWQYDDSGMTVYSYSKQQAQTDIKNLADSFHKALLSAGVEF